MSILVATWKQSTILYKYIWKDSKIKTKRKEWTNKRLNRVGLYVPWMLSCPLASLVILLVCKENLK